MPYKKKKNIGKTVGYFFLGLAVIAATVGCAIAISRSVSDNTPTTNQVTQPTGGNQNNTDDSSNTGGSGNGSSQGGQSSGGNESGSQQENPGSESGGNESSGNEEHETSDTVEINCLAGEVYWYNNVDDSTSWNTLSVVCTLNGLPSNATASDKGLYIYCDDDALDQWIEISVMREGSKVVLNSPYAFQSGETITLTQKKAAPLTGFYKIPLWIFATNYDTEQVYHIIDVWFRTNA